MIWNIIRCKRGTAAVEAAIFTPIFLLFTFGISDLGSAMFIRTLANAAAQVGATYTVANSPVNSGTICSSDGTINGTPAMTAACLSGVKQAMNDAATDASFCSGTVCSASIGPCPDVATNTCVSVSARFTYTPVLSGTLYSWAIDQAAQYTATVRIQ
jgi:Flp pilus assembly protein TadG